MRALRERVDRLHIYISTPMEPNREWEPVWDDLPVTVQRCVTVRRDWKHPDGFIEANYLHLPYDTLLLLHRDHPDVVVSNELGARTVQAVVYAKLYRKKLLIWATVSESTEKGRSALRVWTRRHLLRAADAVIVNGRSGAAYIRTLHAGARLYEIPRSVDFASFGRIPIERELGTRYTLLYVGQLTRRKAILPFVSALADRALAHPSASIRMRIVGRGPQEGILRALRLPPGLSLTIEPPVPYEELPRLYSQAGVLVLPSLADEWGKVVGEALASGLPVLGSTASQAVDELVLEGETGWRFDPLDPSAMRAAIDRFLGSSASDLERMGRMGKSLARRIDANAVASRFGEAVETELAAHPRAGRVPRRGRGRWQP